MLTRIPLRSQTLYSWDSAGFALGLERYDIADHQPHPPGYILYVAAGRLFNLIFPDANTALVAISIICSAAAVVGIYFLGRAIFDRPTGFVTALLLLFSPLGWFYGEVALSYGVELPLAIMITWFLYQMIFKRRYAIAGSIALGLAAGVRQDVMFFFGLFWLIGTLRVKRRDMFLSWAAMATSLLIWLVPLLYSAGGIAAYRRISQLQYDVGVYPLSIFARGFDGLLENIRLVLEGLMLLLGPAAIFLIYIVLGLLVYSRARSRHRMLFLALLPLPALLFFVVFIFDPPGYLLVFGSSFLVFVGRAMVLLSRDMGGMWYRWRSGLDGIIARQPGQSTLYTGEELGSGGRAGAALLATMVATTVLLNTVLFLGSNQMAKAVPDSEPVTRIFAPYSPGRLREIDRQMDAALDKIHQFDPRQTAVIVLFPYEGDSFDPEWRQLSYYLPEYRTFGLQADEKHLDLAYHHYFYGLTGQSEIPVPPEVSRLVFVGIFPHSPRAPLPLTSVPGNTFGTPVTYADMPEDGFMLGPYRFAYQLNPQLPEPAGP